MVAPYAAKAPLRSLRPGKASARTASEVANMAAAPRPWTPRATSKVAMLVAVAHTTEATVKTPTSDPEHEPAPEAVGQ